MSFDPTVSLGNLLQLGTLVVGFVAAWVKLNSRLTSIELEQRLATQMRESVAQQLGSLSHQVARMQGQLEVMGTCPRHQHPPRAD